MRLRCALAAALLALPLAASVGGAQAPAPADVTWFLHRDGTLDTVAPQAGTDASFTFGLLAPHHVTFAAAPLTYNWTVRAPATFHLTLAPPQLTVLGRLQATLLLDGVAVASTDEDLLLDLREKDVALSFQDAPARVPAGTVVALDVALQPFLDVLSPTGLSLVDLGVTMLYDSTAHPSGLRALGNDPSSRGSPPSDASGQPGAPGSNGTDGGQPISPTNVNLLPPLLLQASAPTSLMMLLGVATSAIALVAGLILRGRP